MKLAAIIEDTFREALARKTIIAFAAISTFFLLIAFIVALFVDLPSLFSSSAGQSGVQAIGLEQGVRLIQAGLAGFLHFIALLLAIFATASIVPNAMEKGAIDLLLSKPVSRAEILHGKFLGSVLMVFLNIAWYIVGMWLIIGVKSGVWDASFLLVIPVITFSFIVMYSAVLVIGIASQSSALSIIVSYFFLYLISPILFMRELGLFTVIGSDTVKDIISGVYYALPKPNDFSAIAEAIITGQDFSWMPIWSSAIFAAAMYALALWLFKKKEF